MVTTILRCDPGPRYDARNVDVCSSEQTGFVLKAASRSIGPNGSLQAATKTTIRGEIATWRMEQ
jgi:hypothetical protein